MSEEPMVIHKVFSHKQCPECLADRVALESALKESEDRLRQRSALLGVDVDYIHKLEAKLKESEAKLADKCLCSFCCGLDCGSKEHFESYKSLKSKLSQAQAKVAELETEIDEMIKAGDKDEVHILKLSEEIYNLRFGNDRMRKALKWAHDDMIGCQSDTLSNHQPTIDDANHALKEALFSPAPE